MKLSAAIFLMTVPSFAFAFPTGTWTCKTTSAQSTIYTFEVNSVAVGSTQLPLVKVSKVSFEGKTETLEGLGIVATNEVGDLLISVPQGRAGIPFADLNFKKSGGVTANADLLACQ